MALNKEQVQQIYDALLDGYDEPTLRQMVRVELDVRLDVIAGGSNLTDLTLNLIEWAERHNRVGDLVQGALSQNPGNELLRHLWVDFQQWPPVINPAGHATGRNTRPQSSGTTVAGNVNTGGGDFVGRDEIIHGDRITIFVTGSGGPPATVDRRAAEISYLTDLVNVTFVQLKARLAKKCQK
jgi:hypothetical protein